MTYKNMIAKFRREREEMLVELQELRPLKVFRDIINEGRTIQMSIGPKDERIAIIRKQERGGAP